MPLRREACVGWRLKCFNGRNSTELDSMRSHHWYWITQPTSRRRAIVDDVQNGGAETLQKYAVQFGDRQPSDPLVLPRAELEAAWDYASGRPAATIAPDHRSHSAICVGAARSTLRHRYRTAGWSGGAPMVALKRCWLLRAQVENILCPLPC